MLLLGPERDPLRPDSNPAYPGVDEDPLPARDRSVGFSGLVVEIDPRLAPAIAAILVSPTLPLRAVATAVPCIPGAVDEILPRRC